MGQSMEQEAGSGKRGWGAMRPKSSAYTDQQGIKIRCQRERETSMLPDTLTLFDFDFLLPYRRVGLGP